MGGWGHPFFLLFEGLLRTVISENFVSNVVQATFYTKIVEFLACAIYQTQFNVIHPITSPLKSIQPIIKIT